MAIEDGVDKFEFRKHDGTDWSEIKRYTHGDLHGAVEFRSREALLMMKHIIDDALSQGSN